VRSITPKIVRLGMANAFEETSNKWDRPTRWFGTTIEIAVVDAEPEGIGNSLYDDRVTVIHRVRLFDNLVKEHLLEGLVDLDFLLCRLRSNRPSVGFRLPLLRVDFDLERG
jgi:hypothetical protein